MATSNSLFVRGLGLVSYTKLGDLTAAELNDALTADSISYQGSDRQTYRVSHYALFNENSAAAPFDTSKGAANGVDLYKVGYRINNKGKLDAVTGLLALPTGATKTTLPLLSWQHGTVMSANDAPSSIMLDDQLQRTPIGSTLTGQIRSTETLFNLVRFAGNGYAMAAADYNGNGGSTTAQYYGVQDPTVKAMTGMITASRAILSRLNVKTNKLFLNGWSQGALNSLWLARSLRQSRVAVAKQATSSTFSDMTKCAAYWFNSFQGDPVWGTSVFPLLIGAYESYYNLKGLMKEAFKTQYLPLALAMQQGKLNWDQVPPVKQGEGLFGLPIKAENLLNEKFIKDFNNKRGRFYSKFSLNTKTMDGKYSYPSRFYGGAKDTIIPAGVSVDQPVNYFAPLATGINIGPEATHRSTFVGSLFGSALDPANDIGTWFNAPQ